MTFIVMIFVKCPPTPCLNISRVAKFKEDLSYEKCTIKNHLNHRPEPGTHTCRNSTASLTLFTTQSSHLAQSALFMNI